MKHRDSYLKSFQIYHKFFLLFYKVNLTESKTKKKKKKKNRIEN